MQHAQQAAGASQLEQHSVVVLLCLWPSLCTDDRRALRLRCKTMRDAVDAQAGVVKQGQADSSPAVVVLCPATCARLDGETTLTLRSTAFLQRMLPVAPAGAVFPRLQSLRLHLGAAAIESIAEYKVVASSSPWLTHLSLELPASATALPQLMAGVLSTCSKLKDLAILSQALINLQSLNISYLDSVPDLGPLTAMVNLKSLDISYLDGVTDLATLIAMVDLQSLNISYLDAISDLARLTALVNLKRRTMRGCDALSDLAALTHMVNLQKLNIDGCNCGSHLTPLTALLNLQSLGVCDCPAASDLTPLHAMTNLRNICTGEFDGAVTKDDNSSEDDSGR
ncbi:hypothetical protein FOA52_002813 [Chlamydomonas sp. UWO 241]|nr:hypothetical protein FOA52_002813 [Chlamydomonas sp. UWO 241]